MRVNFLFWVHLLGNSERVKGNETLCVVALRIGKELVLASFRKKKKLEVVEMKLKKSLELMRKGKSSEREKEKDVMFDLKKMQILFHDVEYQGKEQQNVVECQEKLLLVVV